MGTFIKLQDKLIRLEAKNSEQITTPSKAVNEAIEFCKENNLTECELEYDGFLFNIDRLSDLNEKLRDYHEDRRALEGGYLLWRKRLKKSVKKCEVFKSEFSCLKFTNDNKACDTCEVQRT